MTTLSMPRNHQKQSKGLPLHTSSSRPKPTARANKSRSAGIPGLGRPPKTFSTREEANRAGGGFSRGRAPDIPYRESTLVNNLRDARDGFHNYFHPQPRPPAQRPFRQQPQPSPSQPSLTDLGTASPLFGTTPKRLRVSAGIPNFSPGPHAARPEKVNANGWDGTLGAASPLGGIGVPKRFRGITVSSTNGGAIKQTPGIQPLHGGGGIGPMSRIYTERPMGEGERGVMRTLDFRGKYNNAPARSEERSDALRGIWANDGVPVIGSGNARAARQDFGDVNQSPRGIDTGIRSGSPEAEAHGAALASHRGIDIYGTGDRTAHLARNRDAADRGVGSFTKDRIRRTPTKADRAQAASLATEHSRAATATNIAQIGAAADRYGADRQFSAEQYKADRQAETEQAKAAADQMSEGISRDENGVYYGPDKKPLPEEQQIAWTRVNNLTKTFGQAFGKQLGQFLNNGNEPDASKRLVPVYDLVKGGLQFISERQAGNKEAVDQGGQEFPRYTPISALDPRISGNFFRWIESAQAEA